MLQNFLHGVNAKGARSTALHALQWGLGMFLSGLPAAIWVGAPTWILVFLVVFLSLVLLTFLGAYIFLLFKDRDALRSEQYSLSKMAIERGLIGDDVTGLLEENEQTKEIVDARVVNDDEARP